MLKVTGQAGTELSAAAAAVTRAAATLEKRFAPPQVDYVFEPQGDLTLAEVTQLFRILRISAPSDQYLDAAFPSALKRHFRPAK